MSSERPKAAKRSQLDLGFAGRDREGQGGGPPEAYTVSQLVGAASRRLDSSFGEIWVAGEVSNLRAPSSGHRYFTLKDDRAQLPVVIFRSAAARLRFRLADGQQLRCRGRLTIYELQGRFQLTADTAEPLGLGALQLAFEQLKRKLAAEGLFDPRHKKPLPLLPRTVVVVTSRTGAALRDIVRVVRRRGPTRLLVVPTVVQGREAGPEIAEAVRRADGLGGDVMIIGRGGGSVEDLWPFNHEGLARTIFAARTPIISAVGHEIDLTIADLVADHRAPTPSAAAELAVPVAAELQERVTALERRLGRAMGQCLDARRLGLERARGRLGTPGRLVDRARMQVDDLLNRLQRAGGRRLVGGQRQLRTLQTRLAEQQPRARLARYRMSTVVLSERLEGAMRGGLQRRRALLGALAGRLQALSPLLVLGRGYGLVRDGEGRVVTDATRLAAGDPLDVRLARGEVRCVVEKIRSEWT